MRARNPHGFPPRVHGTPFLRRLRHGLAALLTATVLAPAAVRAEWELGPAETMPAPAGGVLTHVRCAARDLAAGGREATVHLVLFDARRATFRVLDQPREDGRTSLGNLLRGPAGAGVLAAVNGGYFHPDYTPLGLTVSDGQPVHPFEKAALLSGLLLVGADGAPALLRPPVPTRGGPPRQALQAGPFLVDGGRPVVGLNARRAARRTAVLTDGRGRWALACTSALTLTEAGALLARPGLGPENFTVQRALNLDGGSSTSLWVRAEPEPFHGIREFGTVRNFLAIVPR